MLNNLKNIDILKLFSVNYKLKITRKMAPKTVVRYTWYTTWVTTIIKVTKDSYDIERFSLECRK